MSGTLSFTSINVLLNAISKNNAGKINGIAFSLAGITKALGPSVGGNVFAWSSTSGLSWPLDFRFVWHIILMSMALALLGLSLIIPADLDKPLHLQAQEEGNSVD